MASIQCPLDSFMMSFLNKNRMMDMTQVKAIEKHVTSRACPHPPLKDLVFHGNMRDGRGFHGGTPLLLACTEGHLESVKHIIEFWGTDVNSTGNYYNEKNIMIKKTTPLFVAAHQGHIEILRYLISKGADVCGATSTQDNQRIATPIPLHGALNMKTLPGQSFSDICAKSAIIVRFLLEKGADPSILAAAGTPVWMLPYCGLDVIRALLSHGLNVNQRCQQGKTILHYWIYKEHVTEEERLMAFQLLANHGTDIMMARDDNGFTPILTAAESCKLKILDLLLKRKDIDLSEKIDATELVGAHLLLKSDQQNFAFRYLRQALRLREGSESTTKKIPLPTRGGRAVEWVTSAQLEEVIGNPSSYWIQSTLTRLRIYHAKSLRAISFSRFNSYYGEEEHRVPDVVTLLWSILDVVLRIGPKERRIRGPTVIAIKELITKLATLNKDDPFLSVETITTSLKLILAADPDRKIATKYSSRIFFMLTGLPKVLPRVLQQEDIRGFLFQLVRRDNGSLLLSASIQPNLDLVRLLLKLGADTDPNGCDESGKKLPLPLHALAKYDRDPMLSPAGNLLWIYGAQPYRLDDDGETAVDIWINKNCGKDGMQSPNWNYRPNWCRDTVPMLKNLSVRTIHQHQISYDKLPAIVHSFVEKH